MCIKQLKLAAGQGLLALTQLPDAWCCGMGSWALAGHCLSQHLAPQHSKLAKTSIFFFFHRIVFLPIYSNLFGFFNAFPAALLVFC